MKVYVLIIIFSIIVSNAFAFQSNQDISVSVTDEDMIPLDSIVVAVIHRITKDTLASSLTNQIGIVDFLDVMITNNSYINDIPTTLKLSESYPNPTNNNVSIVAELEKESKIVAEVYNSLGQRVLSVPEEKLNAGIYTLSLQIGGLIDGVYFIRIIQNGNIYTNRVTKIDSRTNGILVGNWIKGGNPNNYQSKQRIQNSLTDLEIHVFDEDSIYSSQDTLIQGGINQYNFILKKSKSERLFEKPNIVLIMADDLGYETIGAYGETSYSTPNIDRMALNGIRFNYAFSQPLCTPSRVQLMTGIYNIRNYVDFGLLHSSQVTFGNIIQDSEYVTAITGKWQLSLNSDSPVLAGFDEHLLWYVTQGRRDSNGRDNRYSKPLLQLNGTLVKYDEEDYGPDLVNKFAIDFIEKQHSDGNPFLLYYPMILPHSPFSPTPDSPEWQIDTTSVYTYQGNVEYFPDMISYMDKMVGNIISKLEELDIVENTIVIFTGDNGTDQAISSTFEGDMIRGGKGETTDFGTKVPFIVQWPEVIEGNIINNNLIDFTDIFPTILEATSINIPDQLEIDGHSFYSQLTESNIKPREWIYSWFSKYGEDSIAKIYSRNHRFKLYESGEFFDIKTDRAELYPLNYYDLDVDTKQIYDSLNEVIINYQGRRLDSIYDN